MAVKEVTGASAGSVAGTAKSSATSGSVAVGAFGTLLGGSESSRPAGTDSPTDPAAAARSDSPQAGGAPCGSAGGGGDSASGTADPPTPASPSAASSTVARGRSAASGANSARKGQYTPDTSSTAWCLTDSAVSAETGAPAGDTAPAATTANAPVNFLQMLAQAAGIREGSDNAQGTQDGGAGGDKPIRHTGAPATPDPAGTAVPPLLQLLAAWPPPNGPGPVATAACGGSGIAGNTAQPAPTGALDSAAAAVLGHDASPEAQHLRTLLAPDGNADTTATPDPAALAPQSAGNGATTAARVATARDSLTAGSAAAGLHPSAGNHSSALSAPDNTAVDIQTPLKTSGWNEELGAKVTWLAHQGIESASLRLSPEHLGPVEVRIAVQEGAASVWFGASQADTRAALEQALPRLREMFASQGMNLADAGVSREAPRDPPRQSALASLSAMRDTGGGEDSAATVLRVRLGLLDTYA